jgi:hypothetical protein
VTVPTASSSTNTRRQRTISAVSRRVLASGLLGVAAISLVSCASSGSGLIPTGDAGPLQGAFEEVEQAARSGDGSCTATEAALATTEHDFAVLPDTVDAGLRKRLEEGISALRTDALKLCSQPLPQTTGTSTSTSSTSTSTTTAPTQTTSTQTSSTSSTTAPSGTESGAQAPSGEVPPGTGAEQGGGTAAGEGKGATEPRGATGGGLEATGAGSAGEGGK